MKCVVLFILSTLTISSAFYIFLQWANTQNIEDSIFVAMLLFATCFLLIQINKLYDSIAIQGQTIYFMVYQERKTVSGEDGLIIDFNIQLKKVFSNKNSLLSGTIFTIIFVFAIENMQIWDEVAVVRILFLVFIGSVNFLTGIAIYSLSRFLFLLNQLLSDMRIDIWNTNTPVISYIRKIRNKIVFVYSVYSSISLSSIAFSVLEISNLYLGYLVFSVLLLIVIFLLPELIIQHKLTSEKELLLVEFNAKIKVEYERLLSCPEEESHDERAGRLKFINDLFQVRDQLLNNNSGKSVFGNLLSLISAILITVFPIALQIFLERMI
jgi:hypothetical protein